MDSPSSMQHAPRPPFPPKRQDPSIHYRPSTHQLSFPSITGKRGCARPACPPPSPRVPSILGRSPRDSPPGPSQRKKTENPYPSTGDPPHPQSAAVVRHEAAPNPSSIHGRHGGGWMPSCPVLAVAAGQCPCPCHPRANETLRPRMPCCHAVPVRPGCPHGAPDALSCAGHPIPFLPSTPIPCPLPPMVSLPRLALSPPPAPHADAMPCPARPPCPAIPGWPRLSASHPPIPPSPPPHDQISSAPCTSTSTSTTPVDASRAPGLLPSPGSTPFPCRCRRRRRLPPGPLPLPLAVPPLRSLPAHPSRRAASSTTPSSRQIRSSPLPQFLHRDLQQACTSARGLAGGPTGGRTAGLGAHTRTPLVPARLITIDVAHLLRCPPSTAFTRHRSLQSSLFVQVGMRSMSSLFTVFIGYTKYSAHKMSTQLKTASGRERWRNEPVRRASSAAASTSRSNKKIDLY